MGNQAKATRINEPELQPDSVPDSTKPPDDEHNQPDMDEEHEGINGYLYDSQACFDCHPTGSADEGFDHDASLFPLTGAHLETACTECHENEL